jgi:hypothetical protein
MSPLCTDPIAEHWSAPDAELPVATAADVVGRLAPLAVADLDAAVVPYLAAAAAELTALAGIPWRSSSDALPVALLRVISKVGIVQPRAGGPHTARLLAVLS